MCNYSASVATAKKSNSNARLNNLQAVTNAARRAHQGVTTNEAIALYCGVNFRNQRSYKQCTEELNLSAETIHQLPTIDIWGANSDEWVAKSGAAKFYPRAAFDCTEILKQREQEATAEEIGRDYVEALEETGRITAEEAAAMTAATAEEQKKPRRRSKSAKVETAPAMVAETEDDLPF